MAARRTTFGKMERDRAKRAKANAKRERRQERTSGETAEPSEPAPLPQPGGRLSEAEVIDRLKVLHEKFDDGAMGFDDFEEQKAALLARLAVD
jgi:hypothetical protein